MPYFRWFGVDRWGKTCAGKIFCPSQKQLYGILEHESITPTRVTEKRPFSLFDRGFSYAVFADLFYALATLLSSGIRLPEALRVCSCAYSSARVKAVLHECADSIESGVQLVDALQKSMYDFSPLIMHAMQMGHESGSLVPVCRALSSYFKTREMLSKKVVSLLAMPAITVVLFVGVVLLLIFVAVPLFETLFMQCNVTLPYATRLLVKAHIYAKQYGGIGVLIGVLVGVTLTVRRVRSYCWLIASSAIAYTPVLGALLRWYSTTLFFRSLAVLLRAGVPVGVALPIVRRTISIPVFDRFFEQVSGAVAAGVAFDDALNQCSTLFDEQSVALVYIGHESGSIADACSAAAQAQAARLEQAVSALVVIVQPVVMIVLGGMIGGLMVLLYLPLFDLGQHLH